MPVPAGMKAKHHGITVIASLKVAAHGWRSALFDRLHRLLLAGMQTRLRPIGRAITPENIADLNLPRHAWRDAHPLTIELVNEFER